MSAVIIDGRRIAENVRLGVKYGVQELKSKTGVVPGLAVVLVSDDPASGRYVAAKEKAARESGIYSQTFKLPASTSEPDLLDFIEDLNQDDRFHGILIQFPVPRGIDMLNVINAVDPMKDIEGLHPLDVGWLLAGEPRFVPCTPAGIHRMLVSIGHHPDGKHVVVVGGSLIVGRPLAALLLQEKPWANATVTICHLGTTDVPSITRMADILVVATGNPQGITGDMVKNGAVVVDVGIHTIPDPSQKKGYRIVGDVEFDSVKEKALAITPVPGGVGVMTVAMLMVNTLKAARLSTDPVLPPFRIEDYMHIRPRYDTAHKYLTYRQPTSR